MAPDAEGVTLYFGSDLADATVEAAFTTWANDPAGPAQADASFGECERTPIDPILEQLTGAVGLDPAAALGLELGNNLQPVSPSRPCARRPSRGAPCSPPPATTARPARSSPFPASGQATASSTSWSP